jgi:uncharacterized protein (DUF305 family)
MLLTLVFAVTTLAFAHTSSTHPRSLSTLETLRGPAFDSAWVSQLLAFDELLERGAQTVYGEVQRPATRDAVWDVVEASRAQAKLLEAWQRRAAATRTDAAQAALTRADLQDTVNRLTGRTVPNHDMNMSGDADRAFFGGVIAADRYALALAQIALDGDGGSAEVRGLAKAAAGEATLRIARFTALLEGLR